MRSKLEQPAYPMSNSKAKAILRNNFRTEWWQRLDIGQKRTATTSWTEQLKSQILDRELDTVNSSSTSTDWKFPFRRMSMRWHGSSNPQPHPAVQPQLWRFKTPAMAQSGGCPQEALGTGWDTAADCGLHLTDQTDDLAWLGIQKKKAYSPFVCTLSFSLLSYKNMLTWLLQSIIALDHFDIWFFHGSIYCCVFSSSKSSFWSSMHLAHKKERKVINKWIK